MTVVKIHQADGDQLPPEAAEAMGKQMASVIIGALFKSEVFHAFRRNYMSMYEALYVNDTEEFTPWDDFLESMLQSMSALLEDSPQGFIARSENAAALTMAAAELQTQAARLGTKEPFDTVQIREMMSDAAMYSVAGQALQAPVSHALRSTVDHADKAKYVQSMIKTARFMEEDECDDPNCPEHQKH